MTTDKSRKQSGPERRRLTRSNWLEKSLELLAQHGPSHLRIDEIATALGVTKGSFYHHFTDRTEFMHAIAEYWDEHYTREIGARITALVGPAEERLWAMMLAIVDIDAARYDIAVRSWAAQEPEVHAVVERVDKFRLRVVRELFAELGFSGDDLAARTHAFAATMAAENVGFGSKSRAQREKFLRGIFELFVKR